MVTIRKGTETDLDDFFELYWLSATEHTNYFKYDQLKEKDVCRQNVIEMERKELQNSNHLFYVAETDGKIIGVATGHIGPRDEIETAKYETEGCVDEICVAREYRKNGVGKQLLNALCDDLFGRGLEFIFLGVAANNKAVKFYEDNGWKVKSHWMVKTKW
jgi:ribosomal protein S18 acetylase RimI-like enzyme